MAGSVSALMRGAAAARSKQLAYNDQAASYEFNTSAKTQDDYQKYDSYLQKRQAIERDPSKQLTLATTRNSAFSGYTGKEIQRQSTAINYGTGSDEAKLNAMGALWQKAQASGNDNLASSLEAQMASLQVSMQNKAQASQAKGLAAAKTAYNLGLTEQTNNLKQATDQLKQAMETGTPLKGADGQPLHLQLDGSGKVVLDANGHPVQDPNAPAFTMTPNNYRILTGALMTAQAGLLKDAIDNGHDETGSRQTQLDQLTSSQAFQDNVNPSTMAAIQSGAAPTAFHVNDNGQMSVINRPVMSSQAKTDASGKVILGPDGRPQMVNTYESGMKLDNQGNPTAYEYERKFGTSPNSPNAQFEQKPFVGKANDPTRIDPMTGQQVSTNGQQYIVDPVTGKTIYLSTQVDPLTGANQTQRSLEPNSKGPFSTAADFPQAPANYALGAGSMLNSGANMLKQGVGLVSKVPSVVSALATGNVQNLMNSAHNTQLQTQAAAAQAAAAKQAADLANQRQAAVNIPRANPNVPVTASNGMAVGAVGPRRATPALIQAQNTAGSQTFTQAYDPGILAGARTLGLNTNAPVVAPGPRNDQPWYMSGLNP